jgi:hypothetical protein
MQDIPRHPGDSLGDREVEHWVVFIPGILELAAMDRVDNGPRVPILTPQTYLREMRLPTPYAPPFHPVLMSHALASCAFIFSASMVAYLTGCHTKKGAPKHAEKVAWGSVMPSIITPML